MANLPQQTTINQYVADGISTIFVYSYQIIFNVDTTSTIAVYVTAPGVLPNPSTDLQVQGVAYTVQGTGNVTGGTITFQSGYIPINGAIVTLVRAVQNAIDTQFSVAANFSGANLDAVLLLLMLVTQQNSTLIDQRCLRYAIDSYLPSTANNILPELTNIDHQVWMSQGGAIIPVIIRDSGDTSLLRSQLASEANAGDGSRLVGYYNGTPKTVHDELVSVDASIATLNSEVADLQGLQAFYGASLYKSANGSIPANTTVSLGFDTVDFDTNGLFDSAVNGFKILKAGYYEFDIVSLAQPTMTSASPYSVFLYKNGAQLKIVGQVTQDSGAVTVSGSIVDHAAINDTYELRGENDSANALTIPGLFIFSTFTIEFLGT